jgi:POT family proton-dependent oligopeptide transporter
MVAAPTQGGLGFDTKHAASLYGTYTMWVYLTAMPGGFVADRLLGAKLAVLVGGIVIICGHVSMVFHSLTLFYAGLTLIAIGTGLLKPNISTMVGGLYSEDDPRRDSGFSIFYMGINIGAILAPLCVGYLAQGVTFKRFLTWMGLDPTTSWHWGFGAAAVGMTLGLIVYLLNRKRLENIGNRTNRQRTKDEKAAPNQPLTRADWKRIAAIVIFFIFTILFWAAYEQKGASLNLLAKDLVRTEIFGIGFPSSFLQLLTPLFVIMLTPFFAILWVRLGKRQPSSPVKFTFGLVFIGLAYCLMIPAAFMTAQGRISFLWLVGVYFLEVVGEMCLSPVGLSTVTKLAPVKLVGIMMGVWFLAASFGNKLAGYLSGFYVPQSGALVKLYGGIAAGLLISAGILALLTPKVKKLMGAVN